MKNLFLVLFLMFVVITSAFAVPAVTDPAVPRNLHVYDVGGNTYVDLVPHGCAQTRYVIRPGHIKYDTIMAMLLSAQLAGKQVRLRYDDCDGNSMGIVVGVYLQ